MKNSRDMNSFDFLMQSIASFGDDIRQDIAAECEKMKHSTIFAQASMSRTSDDAMRKIRDLFGF